MINPNGDDFVEDNPMAAPGQMSAEQSSTGPRPISIPPKLPPPIGETWRQSDKVRDAKERTEMFVRENPVPIIVGALAIGLGIGWALRHATREEKEVEMKTPLGDFGWSFFSLPFLWPFIKSMREKYEDSADTIKGGVREGVDRVRKIDIDQYAKPLRKRWRSWTS
ncbi:MAG: hypothetical protein ABJB69_05615 [Spartobacteria bacterium]